MGEEVDQEKLYKMFKTGAWSNITDGIYLDHRDRPVVSYRHLHHLVRYLTNGPGFLFSIIYC